MSESSETGDRSDVDLTELTDAEWRDRLTDEQFRVLRESGTEARFSGDYVDHHPNNGEYRCAACGESLFAVETKFESGCGWPAFYAAEEESVTTTVDTSHGMRRTEVKCANCDSHLGHVFDDGPEPTGKRFCINSVAMAYDGE